MSQRPMPAAMIALLGFCTIIRPVKMADRIKYDLFVFACWLLKEWWAVSLDLYKQKIAPSDKATNARSLVA